MRSSAEVFIKYPDGTGTRVVRRKKGVVAKRSDVDVSKLDEDYERVSNCPPYTASFNAMLKERKEKNSRTFVNAVLERMHAESIPLNVVTYNLLLERVVGASDDIVFLLYDEIKEDASRNNSNVQPDLTTYHLLFRACERKGQYHRAFHFYMQMREMTHIIPDAATYDILLGFCAAVKDVPQALFFVEEMKRYNVVPNVNTYNCLMGALREKAPYEETLRVYNGMNERGVKPTVRTFNTVSEAALLHDDYEMAFQLFEEMKKQGVIPNVLSYNALFRLVRQRLDYVIARNKYSDVKRTQEQRVNGLRAIADLALTLFKEMESMSVEPNTFSFNTLIDILIECHDFNVFRIYRMMQEEYRKRNDNKIGTTEQKVRTKETSACVNMEDASATLDSTKLSTREEGTTGQGIGCLTESIGSGMQNASSVALPSLDVIMGFDNPKRPARITAREVLPNVDTYRLMVRACLCFGFAKHCSFFYETMCGEGLSPDYEFTFLMESACEEIRDADGALKILEEAKASGVFVDTHLYNAYLKVLAVVGDSSLLHIVKEMEMGINSFSPHPDVETYNIVLRYHFGLGNYEEVTKLFNSLYDSFSKVRADSDTFCWMFRTHCANRDVEGATQLLNSMQKRKIPVVIKHFHELMRVYLEADDERILDIFQQLQNGGDAGGDLPQIDVTCYSIVMEYHVRRREWEKLQSLFRKLLGHQELEPDTNCYNNMLDMCLACEKYVEARGIFSDLLVKCVNPDPAMYNKLLQIFAAAGDSTIYEVLRTMKNNHYAPEASTLSVLLQYAHGGKVLASAVCQDLFWDPLEDLRGIIYE
uniref:Uncharacterized protein TCIL3000_11_14730 n=1 Tax=Trypanosoma congolense (strain IL3000) TaxID=1068625 RepID=G0V2T4_TRYCI|nr:unnamed protein product [Trypanosoma congolense IL3000]